MIKENTRVNFDNLTEKQRVNFVKNLLFNRDLEDAIRLNFIKREEIPKRITKVLGNTNRDIVNTLVCDVIENSRDKNYIKLSNEVYLALKELVKFNYENIYNKANSKEKILLHVQ